MELRQLEYFVAVADEANFTRAAATLHVTQPGVSAQIRRLERELGQDLLHRAARTVRLTEAGAAALPYARAALAAAAGVQLAVDQLTGLLRGHLNIGTLTSISSNSLDIPRLLAAFHDKHPGVQVSLTVANSDDLIAALQAGRLDLAFIGHAATPPPGIGIHILASELLVAVVAHTDALARKTTITLNGLADRALISLPRGTGLRSCLEDACAAAGFRPHIAFEAGDPIVLAQLAAHGLGVAIVPQPVANAHHKQVHAIAITRPALHGQIALAWRTEGSISPATQAFFITAAKEVGTWPSARVRCSETRRAG
jgi:DNA-binding transcriptional LysR family regulator